MRRLFGRDRDRIIHALPPDRRERFKLALAGKVRPSADEIAVWTTIRERK